MLFRSTKGRGFIYQIPADQSRNKISLNNDPSGSKDPEGFTPLRLVIILFTLTEVELSPSFSGLFVQISLPLAGYGSMLMEQQLDYSQPHL